MEGAGRAPFYLCFTLITGKPVTTSISKCEWPCSPLCFSLGPAFVLSCTANDSGWPIEKVASLKPTLPQKVFCSPLCSSVCPRITLEITSGQEQPPHLPWRKWKGKVLGGEIRWENRTSAALEPPWCRGRPSFLIPTVCEERGWFKHFPLFTALRSVPMCVLTLLILQ